MNGLKCTYLSGDVSTYCYFRMGLNQVSTGCVYGTSVIDLTEPASVHVCDGSLSSFPSAIRKAGRSSSATDRSGGAAITSTSVPGHVRR